MADDVERLLSSIEGRRPSPEFVATLRKRIVEETLSQVATSDGDIVVDVGRAPPQQMEPPGRLPRWKGLAAAAAAALVLIAGYALFAGGRGEDRVDIVTAPDEAVPAVPAVPTDMVVDGPTPPTDILGQVTPLTAQSSFVEEGTYRVDGLGTPFAFSTDEPLWAVANGSAATTLAHPNGQANDDDRTLVAMRLSALSEPARPTAPFESLTDGWPADDFAGWLDNLPDGVIVSNRQDTTVGGFDAVRADIELGEIQCGDESFCAYFGTNRLVYTWDLAPGSSYRIWIVDQGGEAPLALIAAIKDVGQRSWFDFTDQLVSTIIFGDVGPNPISVLPTGRAELPLLGGVNVELLRETVFFDDGRGFYRIPLGGALAGTDFLANPFDRGGNSLESIDAVIEYLGRMNGEITEVEPTMVGELPARMFDVATESSLAELRLSADISVGWTPPSVGRLWVLEHPQRGLLMISAWADWTAEDRLPEAVAEAEALVQSLKFIEPD